MKGETLLCCFLICLHLTGAATEGFTFSKEPLDMNLPFSRTFPHHGLMLLHWFANNIEISQNNIVLKFSAAQGHYGFQKYYPRDRMLLNSDNTNRVYFIVGNLLHASQLPDYVTQDYYNSVGDPVRNEDRLIIRVEKANPENVDRVYILQENIYPVTTSLLRQIQALSTDDSCEIYDPRNSLSLCDNVRYQQRVESLQSVYPPITGLASFLILAGYNSSNREDIFSRSLSCSTHIPSSCEAHNKIKLEVKSTSNGYARISWSGIPENILKMESSVGLYKDEQLLKDYSLDRRSYGTTDTSWPLNPGLQAKLTNSDRVIWAGPEFDEANGVLPTNIRGYEASLQLYTADGYACARLFIKKPGASNWQTVFENFWVGFYKSTLDSTCSYEKYQWVTMFKKNSDQDFSEDYDIFEYKSSLAISPGVQIRFLVDRSYDNEMARTEPWEGVINPDDQV